MFESLADALPPFRFLNLSYPPAPRPGHLRPGSRHVHHHRYLNATFATAGELIMMSVETIRAVVIPAMARRAPCFVKDVFAVATGGHPAGDIGPLLLLNKASGFVYIGGGCCSGTHSCAPMFCPGGLPPSQPEWP